MLVVSSHEPTLKHGSRARNGCSFARLLTQLKQLFYGLKAVVQLCVCVGSREDTTKHSVIVSSFKNLMTTHVYVWLMTEAETCGEFKQMVLLCFSVSSNLKMMLKSKIGVLNDAKIWTNEVRVCSSNPCGLFVTALNAPFSSVFLNLRPLVCHGMLGFSIGSSGRCVFELANHSRVSL